MSQPLSPLLSLPFEILENVAFYAACETNNSLPNSLTNLLCTCRRIYQRLRVPPKALPSHYPTLSPSGELIEDEWKSAEGNASLYARILRFYFSTTAIERRARRPTLLDCTEQLVIYSTALRSIKQMISDPDAIVPDYSLDDALLPVLILLCEDDDGVNRRRVEEAGTYNLVMRYMAHGFSNGEDWPRENVQTGLLLWIAWILTTKARIEEESEEYSDLIVQSILPWVLVPFRYNISYLPPHIYNSTTWYSQQHQPLAETFVSSHGPYPVPHSEQLKTVPQHFRQDLNINLPPLGLAARLLYFARRERYKISIPSSLPANRAESISRASAMVAALIAAGRTEEANRIPDGRTGATKEDLQDWIRDDGGTHMADTRRLGDADWWRMCTMMPGDAEDNMRVWNPSAPVAPLEAGKAYQPGSLSGLWVGRLIICTETALRNVLSDPSQRPRDVTEEMLGVITVPFYMRLSEHVLYHSDKTENRIVPCTINNNDPTENMLNGWLPPFTETRVDGKDLEVRLPGSNNLSSPRYRTWCGQLEEHDEETCPTCQWRETELRAIREDFASVGLAMPEDDEDVSQPEDAEDTDEEMQGSEHDSDMEDSEYDSDVEDPTPPHIPACNGVRDIIVTGRTDPQQAAAWGDYTFLGRVRPSDGLIGIVRTPTRQRQGGRMFFYGYIIGGEDGKKNFTGNWRMVEGNIRGEDMLPGYEGAFSVGLRPEND